jgi:hypothetical protein
LPFSSSILREPGRLELGVTFDLSSTASARAGSSTLATRADLTFADIPQTHENEIEDEPFGYAVDKAFRDMYDNAGLSSFSGAPSAMTAPTDDGR